MTGMMKKSMCILEMDIFQVILKIKVLFKMTCTMKATHASQNKQKL